MYFLYSVGSNIKISKWSCKKSNLNLKLYIIFVKHKLYKDVCFLLLSTFYYNYWTTITKLLVTRFTKKLTHSVGRYVYYIDSQNMLNIFFLDVLICEKHGGKNILENPWRVIDVKYHLTTSGSKIIQYILPRHNVTFGTWIQVVYS